jgi:hypothetical protein
MTRMQLLRISYSIKFSPEKRPSRRKGLSLYNKSPMRVSTQIILETRIGLLGAPG